MPRETWIYDRGDIGCPHCRDTCYFKYLGASYGDSFAEVYWSCACCGWWYTEQVTFIRQNEEIRKQSVTTSIPARLSVSSITATKQYFIFDVLPLEIGVTNHPLADNFTNDFLVAGYIDWIRCFQDNAESFYLRQHVEHTEYVFERFSKKYDLGYEFSEEGFWAIKDKGLSDEWKQFKHEEILDEHDLAYDSALKPLKAHIRELKKCYPELPLLSVDFFEDQPEWHTQQEELNKKYGSFFDHISLFPGFTGLWFDRLVVNNSPEEQSILRSLPYPEYLKTFHWRRIRAAMLLMSNEDRCELCWNKPFALPNGLSDLHVHHKTYKNRGNERFEDLMLICYECHKKAHNIFETSGL